MRSPKKTMETPVKYQVDKPIYPDNKREQVLKSAYFQAVASTLNSLLLGYESFTSDEEVIERAIAFTDQLIEKVGEKMWPQASIKRG